MSHPTLKPASAPLRPSLSLDGLWDFAFEGASAELDGERHRIRTPGIWQTQFPQLRNTQGIGRYRRTIEVPPEWRGKRVVLVMEGVFHESVILLDEAPVAIHGDGWTTIEVDITEALDGKTCFVLGVESRTPDDRQGGRFSQSLAAKQDWYGVHGGIWKPAWIEARAPLHINDVAIQTSYDLTEGTIVVRGTLSREQPAKLRLVVSRDADIRAQGEFELDSAEFDLSLAVAGPEAWSPDSPNLYAVAVELIHDGDVGDAVERTVGFRRFESKHGKLLLNGEPIFLFGALDQDWHPGEECRPPDPEFLEQRFRNAKAMGLNTLRCHVKIPVRHYFDLADRLGLIVWLDMPYMGVPRPRHARDPARRVSQVGRGAREPSLDLRLDALQRRLGHRARRQPDDRRWLIKAFDEAKALVPDSLLVDNSPCFPRNYHVKTDIEDFHWYNGFPHQNEAFAATTRTFADRAPWAWSPHGDAREARRRTAHLLGIRRLGPAASARDRGQGRKRTVVVRKRSRLEPRRSLSARDRDPLPRRGFGADLRGTRLLRPRGARVPVSRAEIPNRDAALGAADLGLCHYRA